jgi:acyl carrier protein
MELNELKEDLKIRIIDTLNLPDTNPDDIPDDGQLVGSDLGIDSIDVLELVVMIDETYCVRIETKEEGEMIFRSINSLAEHIHKYMKE